MRSEVAVQDVRALLEYLTASNAQYALAGGLAVGLWAEHILSDHQKEILRLPVYSEDVDFRGYRFLADGIKAWMNSQGIEMGQISVAVRKGAESMGKIYNMPFRPLDSSSTIPAAATVEILERLPLLDSGIDTPPKGSVLLLAGVHVLDPFSLMVCKLHAFHTRPERERGHDMEHLKILSTLLPDAEKLCRIRGVDLKTDAQRLQAVLGLGDFPLPFAGVEEDRIKQAIGAAMEPFPVRNSN
jgi:hypothetical protein